MALPSLPFQKRGAEHPPVRWGTGGPLPAGGSGTSGFGGAAPLPLEKRERAPPPAGRKGHLSTLDPAAGDPPRGAGGCSRQTGRGDHRLFNGGRSLPAPRVAGDGKNRFANHGPGGAVPAVRPCATPSRTPFSAYPSPFSPPVQLCHRSKGVYRGVFFWGLSPSAQIFALPIRPPLFWLHNSHSGTPPPTLRGGW